jgi:uncharacterized protein YlxW (UPF0749 family)
MLALGASGLLACVPSSSYQPPSSTTSRRYDSDAKRRAEKDQELRERKMKLEEQRWEQEKRERQAAQERIDAERRMKAAREFDAMTRKARGME